MKRTFNMLPRISLILLVFVLSACASQQTDSDKTAHSPERSYRILITNDDGIRSEGIRQLALAVAQFAEVVVVAPENNESGASQSARLMRVRAQATPVDIGDSITAYAVNGTPSDCAAFGVRVFGVEQPFDMVISGVNDGGNSGTAYFYSGTVGAAFQGLADGIPAIAVSQARERQDFTASTSIAVEAAKSLLLDPLPAGVLISINVPAGEIQGIKVLPADGQVYNVAVEIAQDEQGTYYKPVILPLDHPDEGYDIEAYRNGYITVSPLKLDRNAYDSLEALGERQFVTSKR